MLTALLRLVLTLLRISGFALEKARFPTATDKQRLLSAVKRAREAMPLAAALRVLRLSSVRYYAHGSTPTTHARWTTGPAVRAPMCSA